MTYQPFTSFPLHAPRGQVATPRQHTNTLTGSVTDYPGNRQTRWGSNRYRGNCDGRLFADLVRRYQPQSVADPMIGSGTTRDCIAEMNREGATIRYWGGDLNQGFNLITDDLPNAYDFIWIHPPY